MKSLASHKMDLLILWEAQDFITVKSYGAQKWREVRSSADSFRYLFSSNLRSVKSFVKYTTRRAREIAETAIRVRKNVLIENTRKSIEIFTKTHMHLPRARGILSKSHRSQILPKPLPKVKVDCKHCLVPGL